MRKLLVSLLLLFSSAVYGDPKIVLWAVFDVNTQNCHSNNIMTCGADYIAVDQNNLPHWSEQYNLWTDLCETGAQTGYQPFYRNGSNADSVSGNTWYIFTDGSVCRTGLTAPNAETSNGSSGWIDGVVSPNGAQITQGKPNFLAECQSFGGTQDNYGNCMCGPSQSVDPDQGCIDDNQCDTDSIPPTSNFEVNIYTSPPPSDVCINNCLATGGSGISLPNGAYSSNFYSSTGDSCTGAEFVPSAWTQGPPDDPICKTRAGVEYCFDPATKTLTTDGNLAWDFDNGDYYDGYCSITSNGTFACGPESTLPGTDNADPEVPYAADTDGDGVPDFYFISDSASGLARIAPGTAIDTTGDGQADSVAIDTNNDGISDSIKGDSNSDGRPDLDDPSTPNTDESAPPGDTNAGGSGGGNNSGGNDTGDCIDNPNTPWNECDTDGDGEGGDDGDGSCSDDPNTPWNDCNIGVDLDGCDTQPEVTGDPLQAAAIFLAWQSACAGYVTPDQKNNGLDLQDSRPEDDGSFLSETLDLPSALDQSGFLGSGGGLPDYNLSILGDTYTIEVSKWEPFLQTAGALLVVMSLLWAGRLLVEV